MSTDILNVDDGDNKRRGDEKLSESAVNRILSIGGLMEILGGIIVLDAVGVISISVPSILAWMPSILFVAFGWLSVGIGIFTIMTGIVGLLVEIEG